jgi:hypothetical protein
VEKFVYFAFSGNGSRHALTALDPLIDKLLLVIAWSASKSSSVRERQACVHAAECVEWPGSKRPSCRRSRFFIGM